MDLNTLFFIKLPPTINNKTAYYNFYRYSLQLQRYCYEEGVFSPQDINYFELH